MNTQPVIPNPNQLIDQQAHWPLFYLLPQTHYVKRQRAANAHHYSPKPKAEVSHYEATSKKTPFLQRSINRLTEAKNRVWLSLKRLGREVVHALVKWLLLPLAIAACLSVANVSPTELRVDHHSTGGKAVIGQEP